MNEELKQFSVIDLANLKTYPSNTLEVINNKIKFTGGVSATCRLYCTSKGEKQLYVPYKFVDIYEQITIEGVSGATKLWINESSRPQNLPDKCTRLLLNNIVINSLGIITTQYKRLVIHSSYGINDLRGMDQECQNIEIDAVESLTSLRGMATKLKSLEVINCKRMVSLEGLQEVERLVLDAPYTHRVLTIFLCNASTINFTRKALGPMRIAYDCWKNKETIYDAAQKLIDAGFDDSVEI